MKTFAFFVSLSFVIEIVINKRNKNRNEWKKFQTKHQKTKKKGKERKERESCFRANLKRLIIISGPGQ